MNSDTGQVLSILSICSECGISVYILMLILYLFVVVLMKSLNLSKLPFFKFMYIAVLLKKKRKKDCFKHWIVTRIHSALMCCDSNVALHFEYGNCVSVHSGQC